MKSRKLWFFIIWGVIFTLMQIGGNLPSDGQVYSTLMTMVMIGFAGGNVGEHFARKS